jgi:phage shock protein PspC (stress-responsive transcriptional regulator)
MQRIFVTAKLNRTTLQFEENAYQRLESYLEEAANTLERNPDQAEILADLEQAVADQCLRRVNSESGVVSLVELQPALEEIGSVQEPGESMSFVPPVRDTTRRLEQISEGAVISGVCLGLARYFGLDVTLLRVIAVLLLLGSGGGMVIVYAALMLLLPYAPPQPGGPPVRWIPEKSREFVEFLRSKFSMVTN